METFLTWDVLLTYGGCVAATVLLTEWPKRLLPKVPAQLISFIFAAVILLCGHWATSSFVLQELPLYLINAIAVSLAANGGFDALKGIFGSPETASNTLVIDTQNPENTEVYIEVDKEPEKYEDGQIVSFQVKKVSQK